MKHRRAVGMIELLLVLSACTVVLTMTGMLLQRAMRIQMLSRAHVNAERTALRLAEQFRRDVHQARAAITGGAAQDSKAFLRIEFPGGRTAEYSRGEGNVLRLESGGGKPTRREEYAFPNTSEITIEEEVAPQRLVLTVTNKPETKVSANPKRNASNYFVPVSLQAIAVVGRDLPLSAVPAEQEAPQ